MHFNGTSFAVLLAIGLTSVAKEACAQSAALNKGCYQVINVQAADSAKSHAKPIRIVCTGSLTARNTPLYVVDGKLILEQDIKSINPNDIDKIDILKSAAATALYGNRAANGAVIITMKHPARKFIPQPEEQKGRLD